MENQKKKPGAGISFLGFLLTVILTLSFLGNGVLWGLKTTVLSGNGIVDVIKNLDAKEMVAEMLVPQDTMSVEEEMMSQVVGKVLASETFETTLEKIVDGILTSTKVDFSDVKEMFMADMKEIFVESVDEVVQVVESTQGEINAENLSKNLNVQKIEEQYGIAISDMVVAYIEEEYGKTSIPADEVDFEGLKQSIIVVVETEMTPMVEEITDGVVAELEQAVNEEIIEQNSNNEIAATVVMVEEVLRGISMAAIIGIVELVGFSMLEVLLYKKFKNRALRNIGIAALIPSIFIVLLGAAVQFAKTFMVEFQNQAIDPVEKVVMQFVEKYIASIGTAYLIIGGIFFVGAIVCFVFSGKLKKKLVPVVE